MLVNTSLVENRVLILLGIVVLCSFLMFILSACNQNSKKRQITHIEQTHQIIDDLSSNQETFSTQKIIITDDSLVQLSISPYQQNPKSPMLIPPRLRDGRWYQFQQHSDQSLIEFSASSKPVKNRFWADVTARFQIHTEAIHPRTQRYIKDLTDNPHTFNQSLQNAVPYLHYIYQNLKKHNIPAEIALLPIIESQFYPKAVSRAGAAGLWQFTKNTGDFYGLERNSWYDGRFDIVASTQSAIDLLSDLHAQFNSWPLALAAYNYGIGNVKRSIRYNQKRHLKTDYWSLKLPKETQVYVPKLLAYAHLIQNIEQYPQLKLPDIDNLPQLISIELDKPLLVNFLAAASGMDKYEFRRYNPGFKNEITPIKTRYKILIPSDRYDQFHDHLERHYQPIDWHSHVVYQGDTLYDIAKSYGTKVRAIMESNQLKNSLIRPGQKLIIPAVNLNL